MASTIFLRGTMIKRIIMMATILMLTGCYAAPNESHTYLSTTHANGDVQNVKLNVFTPKAESKSLANGKRGAIVFVHGGAWNSKSKSDMANFATDAAAKGFLAIAVDYRLTNITDENGTLYPWPAQANDVRCSLGWLVENADNYNVDVNNISLVGSSSGGQVALMVAQKDFLTDECKYQGDVNIATVVSRAGPTDLEYWYNLGGIQRQWLRELFNAEVPTVEQLRNASPSFNMPAISDTKILIQQGELDLTVPATVVISFTDQLAALGRTFNYISYPEAGHSLNQDTRVEALEWIELNTGE